MRTTPSRSTPILIAATAGNVPEAYTLNGQNQVPLGELLNPLRHAHRCKLPCASPFLIYRADKPAALELADAASSYATRLNDWAAEGAPARAAA
ncbi:NAD(P)H-dependent oxidoreductase [Mesorhizobium sp. B2-4-14]|uniref:NAD(P)H-dependent oxidoreductase n=1 Tax=Mesorhizobium sp. B2-4-14 TaxID=2589935 RepID=UPI00112DC971|nr:NAD(P)H-dependent oxidoreductase [Mesorhizobium sp. B2-4-14]TPL11542.1 NAD(P)H-dependent oxidoreductase [Mesorhizobium sp. B2-4-14]